MHHKEEDFREWNLGYGMAEITTLSKFNRLRDTMPGDVWITSGGMDPIHPGHITSIIDGALRCHDANVANRFVVVVNGDGFLREKRGREFMDLRTRCQIVSGIRGVDVVIGFEASEGDTTVIEAIKGVRPHFFLKGGDRTDIENIPEWGACQEYGVQIITNVGSEKCWASSGFLGRWTDKFLEDFIRDH